jgi:phage terminase large subunit
MTINLREGIEGSVFTPHGGAMDICYATDREVIICGPSETGKTLACCWKLHAIMLGNPKAQGAIVRKTLRSVHGSVLQTFARVLRQSGDVVRSFGGSHVERFLYPNGSVIWVGGMDNADKILSSERDAIYCNQAEELTIDDWEKLLTRTTGRGSVVRHPMLFGDCNPSGSRHWIRQREQEGKLRIINSVHLDNPTLYDQEGNLTEQGMRTMETLESLTGVRRQRLLLGQWATAEGAVYDMFSAETHVVERDHSEFHRWWLTMDEGYSNPAVILLVGDDSDGRWHIEREYYQRGVLQHDVVARAREWALERSVRTVVVDEAAAGLIADLKSNGLNAVGSKGRIMDGIYGIQNRLKVQGDGRPRLTIDPSCVATINEFESYAWKPEKDEPRKENDHAMDAIRYLHAYTSEPSDTVRNPDVIRLGSPTFRARHIPRRNTLVRNVMRAGHTRT